MGSEAGDQQPDLRSGESRDEDFIDSLARRKILMNMTDEELDWLQDFHRKWLVSLEKYKDSKPDSCHAVRLLNKVARGRLLDIVFNSLGHVPHSTARHGCLDTAKVHTDIGSSRPKVRAETRALIGHLTTVPSRGANEKLGCLYIEDSTASVPCMFQTSELEKTAGLIDSWVLVPCWNFVNSSRTGWHIEICDAVLPLSRPVVSTSNTASDVVTSDAALALLHYRAGIRIACVSLSGSVSAVSEIFRIKQLYMFLIQLGPGLSIVVKVKKLFYWQSVLELFKEYIFTNLRPTTLQQGCSTRVRVYVATDDSQLVPQHQHSGSLLSAQAWLTRQGMGDVSLPDVEAASSDPAAKAISYKGRVTAVLDVELGVYELDNNAVRLYVSVVPASNKFQDLREGSLITVYNAHCTKALEDPKLVLYCCSRSCVKVTEFSPLDVPIKCFGAPPVLQKLLFVEGVNWNQLDWLYSMRLTLHRQFGSSYGHRMVEQVCKVILEVPLLSWQRQKTTKRNLLEEFLLPSHPCCLSDLGVQKKDLANCVTVSDVTSGLYENEVVDSNLYWKYQKTQSVGQVLCGVLCLCPKTGRLQLRDDTASVDILIGSCHGDTNSGCHSGCFCGNLEYGSVFPCPAIQTCCAGKLIAVTRYSLVNETFQKCRDNGSLLYYKHIVYLQFSLTDCVYIASTPQVPSSLGAADVTKRSNQGRKLPTPDKQSEVENAGGQSTGQCSRLAIRVIHKEPVIVENVKADTARLRFCLTAVVLDHPYISGEVLLIWQGNAVKWYPVIQPQAEYHLFGGREVTVIKRTELSNSKLEKAVKRSKAMQCFVVVPNVSVSRRYTEDSSSSAPKKMKETAVTECQAGTGETTVADICSSRHPGVYVSFTGVIVSRSHTESDLYPSKAWGARSDSTDSSFPLSALDNRSIKLTVQDVEGSAKVQVYMKQENMAYPLGLIPGTVVSWYRLERKVSAIGNVYCHFTALSSLTLLYSTAQSRTTATTQESEAGWSPDCDVPRRHLVDVWRLEKHGEIIQCQCYVLQVVRLSLKCVCITCSSELRQSRCTNSGCDGSTAARFQVKASLIVSDGTASAMVTVKGSSLQTILRLSANQWEALEEEVKGHGEVFIQQNKREYDSSLERFVHLLCTGSQIKKPLVMILRPNASQEPALTDINNMELQDFAEVSLTTGSGQVTTRCLPLLQLDCLSVQQLEPTDWALHYLSVT